MNQFEVILALVRITFTRVASLLICVFSLLLTQCVFQSDANLDQSLQATPTPIPTTNEPVVPSTTAEPTLDLTTPTLVDNLEQTPTPTVAIILADGTEPFEANDWHPTAVISPPPVPTPMPLPELLAFIEDENAPIIASGSIGAEDNDKLFIIGLDGEIKYTFELAGKSLQDPAWSPDCSQIAFTAFEESQGETISDIMVLGSNSDTFGLRADLSVGNIVNPIWSPDGKVLAFENHVDESSQIVTLALDSKTLTQMTPQDAYYHPAWSINNQIALFKIDQDPFDAPTVEDALYIASPNGDLEELFVLGNYGYSLDWSANGQQLAYVSLDFPTIDVQVSRIILLSDIGVSNARRFLTANIYPDDLLLGTVYHERNPVWLPSGEQVAYVREHAEGEGWVDEICLADVETGASTCLPNSAEISIHSLDWCPVLTIES